MTSFPPALRRNERVLLDVFRAWRRSSQRLCGARRCVSPETTTRSASPMTRLLTTTAIGLLMGLTPALAQTDMPADQSQTPPAMQEPATPSEVAPVDPGEPGQPIPDDSAEAPAASDDIPNKSVEV